MYDKHFGLKTRPFGTKAESSAVFVGPRQAKTIASLQKGVGAPDAVVTVTGPVGTGKTTLVDRALETLPTGRTAARIGRMQLTQEEVVDLVMGGFGIKKSAGRSIQRFAAFRRILQQQRDNGIPVAIVIEDAQRLGVDALAEVEALTAADTGDTASGNIILMGQPGLHELLMKPELGRLKQRVRLRLNTETLSSAEVQGYLKHVIREAGGDYEAIFDAGVADIVYRCSEGIPRMINTLCETAMTTAMEDNSVRVSAALMRQVATEAFGYDVDALPVMIAPAGEVAPVEEPVADPEEDIDWEEPPRPKFSQVDEVHAQLEPVSSKPAIGHDMVVESGHYPMSTPVESPQQEPVEVEQVVASETVADDVADDYAVRIPELINDTQPELPRLDALAFNAYANIPVLDTPTDESDIESTQTLAQPVGLAIDEAVGRKADAELAKANSKSGDDAQAHFDLDAALSPDVESTNVMPGLTTNLDSIAPEKTEPTVIQKIIEPGCDSRPAPLEIPDELDLPTLSDSMRVDVKKEVDRASETEPSALVAVQPEPEPVAEQLAAPEPEPEMTPEAAAEPVSAVVAAAAPEPTPEPEAEPEPEMIPETEPVSVTATAPEPAPEPEPDPEPEPIPESALVAVADLTAEHSLKPADVPNAALDEPANRNPVPANDTESHSPDIDALESALAAARNDEFVTQNPALSSPSVTDHQSEPVADDPPAVVPEITLDKVISEQQAQLAKLDQFRNEIGNVNSLEDVSDDMAETLFGVEFEALAAAAIADPNSPGYPDGSKEEAVPSPVALTEDEMPIAANDASELKLEQPEEPAAANDVSEFKLGQPEVPDAANDAAELKSAQPEMAATSSVNDFMPNDVPLNESTALRIDMLNAMKVKAAAMAENVELGSDKPPAKGPQPEPIERQMNTSITQTLEALNVAKMEGRIAQEKEDKQDKKSGGLFSRFRKSS